MNQHAETLSSLGQGHRIRATFQDGMTMDLRIDQMEYHPGDRLRAELTCEDRRDRERYRAEAHAESGEWAPLTIERFDLGRDEWVALPQVTEITPMETYRTVKSRDMVAQDRTGNRE